MRGPHDRVARGACTSRDLADGSSLADVSLAGRPAREAGVRTRRRCRLLRGDEAIGVDHPPPRRGTAVLTEQQIALLQTFADQAVIAIENARLFTELEERNRDLTESLDQQTATADILRAISQAQTDVQPVFEAIADSAMRLFGAWWVRSCSAYDGELISLAAARGGLPGSSERHGAAPAPRRRRTAL